MNIIGKFTLFIFSFFVRREAFRVYARRFFEESIKLGFNSIFIVAIVAFFIGAVTAVQTAHNLISPLIPKTVIGMLVRDMSLLELAPTITCIVLAGKVGSHIAGELGTMRITEQVDALEVMGINSTSYLVLPKIMAAMFTFPFLVILAGFLSMFGGYLASIITGITTEYDYVYGLRLDFIEFNVLFAIIKSIVFAFLISSISSFKGFYTKGGALEVGQASTAAVTNSCIAILLADYLLAELLL